MLGVIKVIMFASGKSSSHLQSQYVSKKQSYNQKRKLFSQKIDDKYKNRR